MSSASIEKKFFSCDRDIFKEADDNFCAICDKKDTAHCQTCSLHFARLRSAIMECTGQKKLF
jgi:hypothetical protein